MKQEAPRNLRLTCKKCMHVWYPFLVNPRQCPRCRTRFWRDYKPPKWQQKKG